MIASQSGSHRMIIHNVLLAEDAHTSTNYLPMRGNPTSPDANHYLSKLMFSVFGKNNLTPQFAFNKNIQWQVFS
jgi:hypothetical protein